MWLNPLKGDHLTLRQLDKTLPVSIDDASSAKIERGIFVYISTNKQAVSTGVNEPRFALYTSEVAAKPNAVPYIALQSLHDTQANMAGNTVQAPSVSGNLVDDYGVKVGSKPEGDCQKGERSGDNERLFLKPMSKYALLRITCDKTRCVSCGKCERACPMDVEVTNNARSRRNGTECILCMECVKQCAKKAL